VWTRSTGTADAALHEDFFIMQVRPTEGRNGTFTDMKKAKQGAAAFSIKLESDPGFQQNPPAPVRIWVWLASAIFLGSLFVVSAVFYVWLYVGQVQNGYRLSKAYEESELLSNVQRKLTIEWSRFRDPQFLEEIGRNQFGLAPPRPAQKVLMR
jgi:hypothetical protein